MVTGAAPHRLPLPKRRVDGSAADPLRWASRPLRADELRQASSTRPFPAPRDVAAGEARAGGGRPPRPGFLLLLRGRPSRFLPALSYRPPVAVSALAIYLGVVDDEASGWEGHLAQEEDGSVSVAFFAPCARSRSDLPAGSHRPRPRLGRSCFRTRPR